MCWSGEASAALAAGGLATSFVLYKKGESPALYSTLAYFSAMEALQAYTYSVVGQCHNPRNQVATTLAYVHIAFQPFFINAFAMQFIPTHVRRRIRIPVFLACLAGAILLLLRLFPFAWATPCFDTCYASLLSSTCLAEIPFCGKLTCATRGVWHLAWQIPANYHFILDNSYFVAGYLLPLIYGSWRIGLYNLLTGPILAALTTNDANEWAAVWCLYSVALLGSIVIPPLRRRLSVSRWPGWKPR